MTLKLEALEGRESPAVHFYLGTVAPSPQGDPGSTTLYVQSDHPGHFHREFVPPASFTWQGVHPDRVVIDL